MLACSCTDHVHLHHALTTVKHHTKCEAEGLWEVVVAKIVIVGTGYVGLTTGACFAHNLHHVCCLDVDVLKITRLQACDVPIYEPGLDQLVKECVHAGRLRFTTDYAEALRDAEYVFVAVGTPAAENGASAELRYVHEAAESI